jgi:hypothetical protein
MGESPLQQLMSKQQMLIQEMRQMLFRLLLRDSLVGCWAGKGMAFYG